MSSYGEDSYNPRELIPEVCRLLYQLGWVTGTGGGISMKKGDVIYIAPSGIQKERIQPQDIFEIDIDEKVLASPPAEKGYRLSECLPLFMLAYTLRDAAAVIHSHSQNVVLASMLVPGNEFRISHIEMIKGIKKCPFSSKQTYNFDETLVIPIIENTNRECQLTDRLRQAMIDYPETCAVIVRQHGIYCWGPTWGRAKSMLECYDYLLELGAKMMARGIPTDRNAELKGPPACKKQKTGAECAGAATASTPAVTGDVVPPQVNVFSLDEGVHSEPTNAYTGFEAVRDALKIFGVKFEKWEPTKELTHESSHEEVLEAYKEDVDRINKEYGFVKNDVCGLGPDHPKRVPFREKFLEEHYHNEPEVRLFETGASAFYLHTENNIVQVVCTKGHLIGVPARTRHWFDMGEFPNFRAIRFFGTDEGWVAQKDDTTNPNINKRYPTFETRAPEVTG